MDNLKKLRKEKGYTQEQLAQFVHTGTSVVARWELGQTSPTPAQLLKLCSLLGCKPRQLFCCENYSENSVPVFEGDYIKLHHIPFDCSEKGADFGIVLNRDLSARFCDGDVCFFTISDCHRQEDIVFALDKDCNGTVLRCCDLAEDMKIVAVCTALHQKL